MPCPKCGSYAEVRTCAGIDCHSCGATKVPAKTIFKKPVYRIGKGMGGKKKWNARIIRESIPSVPQACTVLIAAFLEFPGNKLIGGGLNPQKNEQGNPVQKQNRSSSDICQISRGFIFLQNKIISYSLFPPKSLWTVYVPGPANAMPSEAKRSVMLNS